jgi:thiol-disulfide isomerase/thioredoxin
MISALAFTLLLQTAPATAASVPTADQVVSVASVKAKASGKNVVVLFHASWCGWCHKLDDYLARPAVKPLFAKSYEIVHLTVLENEAHKADENAGGDKWLEKLGGKDQGIPYFAILNPTGKVLADSRAGGKQNVGFPAAPEEVAHFLGMLKKTSKLSPAELKLVESELLTAGKK